MPSKRAIELGGSIRKITPKQLHGTGILLSHRHPWYAINAQQIPVLSRKPAAYIRGIHRLSATSSSSPITRSATDGTLQTGTTPELIRAIRKSLTSRDFSYAASTKMALITKQAKIENFRLHAVCPALNGPDSRGCYAL